MRLGLVLGIGLVLWLAFVLGLVHFTFLSHTQHAEARIPAGLHFTHCIGYLQTEVDPYCSIL